MKFVHYAVTIGVVFAVLSLLNARECLSQAPARALDALLQDYAYRAFVRPRTGVPFVGTVPSNLTGIRVAALRLRSGSLKRRGFRSYGEFEIPAGVTVNPYVERLVLVYQNLGNWSSVYYPLSGYSYLAPVLGLFAYDAVNLSATGLPELNLVASGSPILINFTNVGTLTIGSVRQCVFFGLDGSQEYTELRTGNVCSVYREGHYAIVVNSTGFAPSPSPTPSPPYVPGPVPSPPGRAKSKSSKVLKIVGGAIGGIVGLLLLAFLVLWVRRNVKKKKVAKMERRADAGVSLRMAPIGGTQAPVATSTRTQPKLENEYIE